MQAVKQSALSVLPQVRLAPAPCRCRAADRARSCWCCTLTARTGHCMAASQRCRRMCRCGLCARRRRCSRLRSLTALTRWQFPLRDLDLRVGLAASCPRAPAAHAHCVPQRYTSGGVQEEGQGGTRMEVDGEPEGSAAGGRTLYQLCSVVCHQGRGIDTGHWTSVCRDPEPGRGARVRTGVRCSAAVPTHARAADAWLRFNDIRVSIVPEEEVAASQASLLVYQRTGYVA